MRRKLKMTNGKRLEKEANGIAAAIAALVEHTDGPVTLAEIERVIPGFASTDGPNWAYVVNTRDGEKVIWQGMTEAGQFALGKVMKERRVAVQYVNTMPYLLEGRLLKDEHWLPVVLLPARAANLETPNWLVRASPSLADACITQVDKTCRPLTPGPVRFTADQFSV